MFGPDTSQGAIFQARFEEVEMVAGAQETLQDPQAGDGCERGSRDVG